MSQPPKSTILASSSTCLSYKGVRCPTCQLLKIRRKGAKDTKNIFFNIYFLCALCVFAAGVYCVSSAWYDERTNGPALTQLKPSAFAATSYSANWSGWMYSVTGRLSGGGGRDLPR